MDTHKNASLTPKGREAMVRRVIEDGLSKASAARRFNTTPKTVAKWVERFRAEGDAGDPLSRASGGIEREHQMACGEPDQSARDGVVVAEPGGLGEQVLPEQFGRLGD